jgi:hypothetical protein
MSNRRTAFPVQLVPPIDELLLRKIVVKIVSMRVSEFRDFPDVDADDLIQDCTIACRSAWQRYDRDIGASPVTYFYAVTNKHLLFRRRTLMRRLARDCAAGQLLIERQRIMIKESMRTAHEPSDDLSHWMRDSYVRACNRFLAYGVSPAESASLNRAQVAVLLALKHRLGVRSLFNVLEYLGEHRKLLQQIGLDAVPRLADLTRAKRSLLDLSFS